MGVKMGKSVEALGGRAWLGVRPVVGTERVYCRVASRKSVNAYYRFDPKASFRERQIQCALAGG